MGKSIPAGRFKQGCLAILDEVERSHVEVTITKRGRAVARLVPIISDREREQAVLAQLRGKVHTLVSERELLAPSLVDAGWNLDPDDD